MLRIKNVSPRRYKVAIGSLLSIGLLTIGTAEAWSQDRSKPETIEASARGTEAQMEKNSL